MQERQIKYDTIDLFKFIGSIMVFLMHLNMFADSETFRFTWELLTRWAVPFFFIISSYFLFSKEDGNNIDKQTLLSYIKRLAILYLAWFLINIPSTVYLRLIRPGIGQLSTWMNFIKGTFLSSTFHGSWYLSSSIVSAILFFKMSKRFDTRLCIAISAIPYVLCLLTSAYGGLLPVGIIKVLKCFYFPLNIFGGLLYFSLGKYIYENKELLLKGPVHLYVCLALLSIVLFIIEIRILVNESLFWTSDFAIAILPMAVSIVLFCLKSQFRVPKSKA